MSAMTVDHVGKILFPQFALEAHVVGRLAFPVFAILIGLRLLEDPRRSDRYIKWLVVTGLVAEPFYQAVFGPELNIMFTLALGIGFHESTRRSDFAGFTLAAVCAGAGWFVDGGSAAVVAIGLSPFLLAVLRVRMREANAIALAVALVLLIVNIPAAGCSPGLLLVGYAGVFAYCVVRAAISTSARVGRSWRLLFYAYYPAHLYVLNLLTR